MKWYERIENTDDVVISSRIRLARNLSDFAFPGRLDADSSKKVALSVKQALENKLPLEFVSSCYQGGRRHCGVCESCTRLKNALLANDDEKYIGILF